MKKATVLILLTVALTVTHVKANVIAVNLTSIHAQLTNLKDFPDLAVVAYEKYDQSHELNYAKNVTQRFRGIMPMSLCIVKKSYLKKVDLLKNDWQNDKHAQKLNLYMDETTCSTPNYESILVDYTLVKKGKSYYVYKSGVTYTYRAIGIKKAEKLVKTFKDNVADPSKLIYFSEYYL